MASDWQVCQDLSRGFVNPSRHPGRAWLRTPRGARIGKRRRTLPGACGHAATSMPEVGMRTDWRPKSFRGGEIALAILARLRRNIEARPIKPYAFHMGLGAFVGAAGIFAIFQRFNARAAERPP